MTTDDEPIVRTTSRRLAKGLAVVIGVMILGAVIAIINWDSSISTPPASSKLKPKFDLSNPPSGHGAPTAATPAVSTAEAPAAERPQADVTLTILEGAATQGNPDYDPKELTVKKGNTILVDNVDLMPHTVTNGAGPNDPNSAKIFDTSLIMGGESGILQTEEVDAGEYTYYCTVHPYMTGTLKVG
jgi:plastocyanin